MISEINKAIRDDHGKPTGLIFTSDEMPGYSRKRSGRGFSYRTSDGTLLSDRKEKSRINSLAIPPAYEDVWICMRQNGHLQATGMDSRRRKQYRYHPGWHDLSADRKFSQIPEFAMSLPKIRDACRKALALQDLDKDRVIAGIVFLLDSTGYRIGGTRYEKENRSYGISSLLTRHIREHGDGSVGLKFRGKGGKDHETNIASPHFSRLVEDLHELPGQHLFRYEDGEGQWHDIGSAEVNDWIKQTSGGDFSAKQFRTWKASVLCARELGKEPAPESQTDRKRAINSAIRETAGWLNHTLATCRKYYIHPSILEAYGSGHLHKLMGSCAPRLRKSDNSSRLHADERRVLKLIGQRA